MPIESNISRRGFLAGLWASTALAPVAAQTASGGEPFSFARLKARMKKKSSRPYLQPEPLDSFLDKLTYDDYRNIYFRPSSARWADAPLAFRLEAFHPGWLFQEPVKIFEVVDGLAKPMAFSTDDFEYRNELAALVPEHAVLSGVAGLKINTPMNTSGKFDELITFLGASYFRALGRGNSYGLSARGLSIDTWLGGPEEFPRFSAFWVVRPDAGDETLEIFAAMDSASVTGAYRFVISPGDDTVIEVESELYFRRPVEQLGLAPLTSMFYFAEHSERRFDDFRPQVHDSDGLKLILASGDELLRPLNNPPRVSNSYFSHNDLQQFGLIQRDRSYDAYQDAGAQYHKRPSVMIERLGDWGPGSVRLIEIPADLEIEDNIVIVWIPDNAPQAGETRSYSFKMHWGALPPVSDAELAFVHSTRTGVGGPSGVPVSNPNLRKFVIDFEGGALGRMPADAEPSPVVTTSVGEISDMVLHKIDDKTARWRLFFDVDAKDAELVELMAHVAGPDKKLSEVWLFQWVRDARDPSAQMTEVPSR